MKRALLLARGLLAVVLPVHALGCGGAPHASTRLPAWTDASGEAFARASREERLVLLSVQADWCHWCHVMNATTYTDPAVLALLEEHFVVLRAEADARPDLAERYASYGWPATILFGPDGHEVVRLRGYRDPAQMRAILEAVIGDQRAGRELGASLDQHVGASVSEPASDDLDRTRDRVRAQLDGLYDDAQDGWGARQKYPFAALVQHALVRGREEGDAEMRARGLRSLARYAELIDPVWGGMYQYSDDDWAHPHFEKIADIQAGAIAAFADARAASGELSWVAHAHDVVRYLDAFLTLEDGAFAASQDADLRVEGRTPVLGHDYYALADAERRALGLPHVDAHAYASVNGALIAALARLSEVAPDEGTLDRALRAAAAVDRAHRDERGLYRHDAASDDGVRYLADQARMLQAFVALHQASGDARWLARATDLADATLAALADETGALRSRTAPATPDPLVAVLHPIEENAIVARALMSLARLEHDDARHETALAILRGVAVPSAIAELGRKVGEYAIALELASLGTIAFTVVGPARDPRTQALADAVRAYDEPRRVLVLQDGEGEYPVMDEPVVFVCARDACSSPLTDPDRLAEDVDAFLGR